MTRKEAAERAEKLVSQMTLAEKAGQLLYRTKPVERLGIKDFNWWNEALHGVARADVATVFPQAIALAASFDPELIKEVAEVISTEARAKYNQSRAQEDFDIYKNLTYWSPNINIFRDPRWGRGQETYGEDPFLTSELGTAFVKGIQGDGEFLKAAACAKHYAVHSGPEKLRHTFNAECNMQDLWETYLPAFEKLVKAGAEGVMGAYNRTNGELCCAHPYLMNEVLFKQWGFEGYFVSDCGAVCDFHQTHKVTKNGPESAAKALNAGCDINCGKAYENIIKAVEEGLLSEETVSESVVKALTTRILLGEFEENPPFVDIPFSALDCEEHRLKNLDAARRSLVLLKNDGLLPLNRKDIKSLAVIGPNANSVEVLKGNYNGVASEYVTVVDGIRKAAPEIRINYSLGADLLTFKTDDGCGNKNCYSSAVAAAKHSDAAVICVGLDATVEGEESPMENGYIDRGDKLSLTLPQTQLDLIDKVMSVNDKVIIVLMSGSSIDVGKAAREKASAIISAWYPGAQGGNAVAELIFGDYSPSGRLPVTFYDAGAVIPEFTDYSMENRTYRFYRGEPAYPFGYGLSYAEFEYGDAKLAANDGDTLRVSVNITNKSGFDAREVTQVYAKYTDSRLRTPIFQLCGISSNMIPAGGTVAAEIEVSAFWLKAVDNSGRRIDPDGEIILYVGGHQPDAVSDRLCGGKCEGIKIK